MKVMDSILALDCPGCRNGVKTKCGITATCIIPSCSEGRGIDFCFECEEFPCERVEHPNVRKKWLPANRRMAQDGVEAYFLDEKEISHYAGYKEETEKE